MSRPFQIYQISRGAIGALEQAEGVGGAVAGVTIVRNRFINCASPVIGIDPENDVYKGPVHRGIVIEDNTFEWGEAYRSAHPDFTPTLISAEAVDGIIIRRNSCNIPCNPTELKNCTRIVCP